MSDADRRRDGQDRADVQINVNLASLGPYYLSKLTNISVGGAFIQHPNPEPVGTVVNISFKLPNDDNLIKTRAKVVWKYIQGGKALPNGTGMGIEFVEISKDARKRILDYIQNILNADHDTTEVSPIDTNREHQSV
ncbi:MAG: PilZ domain-containing protein [Bdellovibrionota bacterium]|nr:PilZ domain-containing protein [Deltaproteobacteria bacterium]